MRLMITFRCYIGICIGAECWDHLPRIVSDAYLWHVRLCWRVLLLCKSFLHSLSTLCLHHPTILLLSYLHTTTIPSHFIPSLHSPHPRTPHPHTTPFTASPYPPHSLCTYVHLGWCSCQVWCVWCDNGGGTQYDGAMPLQSSSQQKWKQHQRASLLQGLILYLYTATKVHFTYFSLWIKSKHGGMSEFEWCLH